MATETSLSQLHLVGLAELRKKWGWFFGLGIVLVVLGAVAIGSAMFMTLLTVAAMVFFGWLMLVGGVLQTIHAFATKEWSGFFLDLLAGVLYIVVGFMIIANPAATAVALTLMIAVLLILGGIFRIVTALAVKFQNRMWLILHGAINLLLGFSIWSGWPLSALWVIGLFIGIDMIFNGLALVMLGLAAKKLPGGEHA